MSYGAAADQVTAVNGLTLYVPPAKYFNNSPIVAREPHGTGRARSTLINNRGSLRCVRCLTNSSWLDFPWLRRRPAHTWRQVFRILNSEPTSEF